MPMRNVPFSRMGVQSGIVATVSGALAREADFLTIASQHVAAPILVADEYAVAGHGVVLPALLTPAGILGGLTGAAIAALGRKRRERRGTTRRRPATELLVVTPTSAVELE